MASNSKIFVSPGVYTSERDLSFVSQSVGVTTLGIVGETLKGPAFEPIFVTNYDEFSTYFGGTTPEKFVNTQIPKYEAAYIAKSYLQQSNQLFVTRVLGLSGYDAGPSWSISTVANVNCDTVSAGTTSALQIFYTVTTGGTVTYTTTGPNSVDFTGTTVYTNFDKVYTKFDGTTSTYRSDINSFLTAAALTNSLSATTSLVYGPINNTQLGNLPTISGASNKYSVTSISATSIDYCDRLNDAWYYANFNITSGDNYGGYSYMLYFNTDMASTGVGAFSGSIKGTILSYAATAHTDYNGLVIATLRSRGISTFSSANHGDQYQLTANTATLLSSGSYSAITQNPFATFAISGTDIDNQSFSFETSFTQSSTNYLSKVFGTQNFEKDRTEVPLFVEERYQSLLTYGYNKGYIRGLNTSLTYLPEARNQDTTSIGFYLERYQTPKSPWVVSELRGNLVYQLFRVHTISDGNSANYEVKISLANMSFNNGTFDLLVRDYFDTDANPVVIEKFTNCTMDPSLNSYVGKKVGSFDGEFAINSKFIMLELNADAPIDSMPCGFEGYVTRTYTGKDSPFPIYKTKYDIPGEEIYNPPFGSTAGDDAVLSPGDNIRRTYLGISDSIGYDADFFNYKGKQNYQGSWCNEGSYTEWDKVTKGFHMDSGATVVTIANSYATSGQSAFEVGQTSFRSDPSNSDNPYFRIFSRKFTFLVQGGFDGWDIYREYRTNGDSFVLGQSGYKAGQLAGCTRYPDSTGWGLFKPITVEDNTTDYANTDYYAYLLGIQSFNNPEVTNINVFVTPGIDFVNNSNLVESSIDMIENDRADSIYIATTPDFDLLQPSTSMDNLIYPQEIVDELETSGIDSNYTATYYPWVLTRDTVNNTQIYLPATAEVTRNLALTDNIAFPWFATAGYTRGVVNAIRARRRLTQEDRDTLYKGRINPIATFNDVGTVIWGNKTLQVAESALDRINVRRLLLQARKLISAVAVRLLFEQNDNIVRQQFLDSVNPILDAIRRDRGLYDFRVTVSNTPEDLDRNQLVGKIYIKPTKALEFIDIEFLITPTGASFENI
jgi:hypothetical protein